MLKGY